MSDISATLKQAGLISYKTSNAALLPACTAPSMNPVQQVAVSVPAQNNLTKFQIYKKLNRIRIS